jgi:hypothetical protein
MQYFGRRCDITNIRILILYKLRRVIETSEWKDVEVFLNFPEDGGSNILRISVIYVSVIQGILSREDPNIYIYRCDNSGLSILR